MKVCEGPERRVHRPVCAALHKLQGESEGQPLLLVPGPLDTAQLLDIAIFEAGLGKIVMILAADGKVHHSMGCVASHDKI